ncbi:MULTISPECIES: thiamine pyrophosphate-dependent enzyme [Geobacter]|jgi:2-oxoglutarate ferredoxin oxidoreductase subunit beta|uniref:2-oxoacid:ferredoxin oxidoreductase, thiamin diphosphate-binding subunit n=3 Tax=Geobacter TaxID=28231 RepID=Q74C16_GEOSL|nr:MULTISPECIES: thiamine pyrophosphate-dependent enzyme [Geobacter]AAR35236.1 2-oxoacid:ferredoxin oxidoreductase, thiamin diphosphate-binding subunit [Geobacter sulfurreducens PCA]ADI84698.1 2-oxoacid:ferredoxin oxidoreductase, thiamin diphosphate-binding subunit [Geobacter sulfurreducens KN400]AJY68111.1 2-oxoglutarate oxidoreductase [Geobacter sulfurreducens]ANA40191.1 2-oxoglutarate oxidoreductase [Geobacter anodireducens]KIE42094.1 2-oxoglutarate oxidoreductase [Geobacter soli]
MQQVFKKPVSLKDVQTHFCPGCHHGTFHRLVAEAMDEFGVQKKTIGVASVGCSVFLYGYFDIDVVEAPHGRAPAVATGVKRARPDAFVFTYQGDGDLAAIGTSEIIHAANRGEDITVIFVNNTTYGMTGGQMAPTTLVGQRTSTSPYGRKNEKDGSPIRMAELLAQLEGVAFSARVAVNNPKNLMDAKRQIKKAFRYQAEGKGFSFIEALSSCPTNWGMDALAANERVGTEMCAYFPLGVFKNTAQL